MSRALNIIIAVIALEHLCILVLEMFLWEKQAGLDAFDQTKAEAASTRVVAANQGLYNGFLAAGLFWGLSLSANGTSVKVFFLSCVLIAGLFGAATAKRGQPILFLQAIPAALGLVLVFLS